MVDMMKQALGGLNGLLTAILDISQARRRRHRTRAGDRRPRGAVRAAGGRICAQGRRAGPAACACGRAMCSRAPIPRCWSARCATSSRTRCATPGGRRADRPCAGAANNVRIDVIDTGVGIPPKSRARFSRSSPARQSRPRPRAGARPGARHRLPPERAAWPEGRGVFAQGRGSRFLAEPAGRGARRRGGAAARRRARRRGRC